MTNMSRRNDLFNFFFTLFSLWWIIQKIIGSYICKDKWTIFYISYLCVSILFVSRWILIFPFVHSKNNIQEILVGLFILFRIVLQKSTNKFNTTVWVTASIKLFFIYFIFDDGESATKTNIIFNKQFYIRLPFFILFNYLIR